MTAVDFDYVIPTGINAGRTAAQVFDAQAHRVGRCIEWTGKMFTNGYGCFTYRGRYLLAHRVAVKRYGCFTYRGRYLLAHRVAVKRSGRSLNARDVVCHKCDNRKCVRPSHLIVATQLFNMQDAKRKGRLGASRGCANHRAQLTEKCVRDMRRLRSEGILIRELSERYGVSTKQVSLVTRRKQWAHIND